MKIGIISDWYLPRMGGLELHVRDLARELTARGCDVHVVTPTRAALGAQAHGHPGLSVPEPEGVRVHRLAAPLMPRHKFVYTRGAFTELATLLRRERFDVVHSMVGIVTPAAIGGAWVANRLDVPVVVTFHSMLFGFRHVLRALDLCTGWSHWPLLLSGVSGVVAAEASETLGGRRTVHVLPNGVDPGDWRAPRIQGVPGELRLASVMRLNPRKRGGALLRTVARAQRALGPTTRLRLTLVGDGPEAGRLRRLAESLGIAEAVDFTGFLPREDVRDVLARADVFILASLLESFGIAALEARASGVPVLALDRGGIKEFVRHERDGLIASSDAELLAHLLRVAREPELLARLTRGAAEDPIPMGWDNAVERHLAAYHLVREGRGGGACASDPPEPCPREGLAALR